MLTMHTIPSPLGPLRLYAEDDALVGLHLPGQDAPAATAKQTGVLALVAAQLAEYFAGERREFTVPLGAKGSGFQARVWSALTRIPFGTTRSYGDLARELGQPTASRAVGAANGKNPIAIIVPCHRVIGSTGELTGYAGGMPAKRWLLAHESNQLAFGHAAIA